eukprot:CAMPEP_0168729034 /NCGR_PEP_ID=MMETSP0724-20121128/5990_1 /TAXON_ID=265536 /ORGANISM="Amphiprora sp., Strain CCMP467" /LENGTH=182 /DNA_ID=CAMNT_0008775895 /DNA_START=19 /DNA_END=567 /DNA_ORIENTATION=-
MSLDRWNRRFLQLTIMVWLLPFQILASSGSDDVVVKTLKATSGAPVTKDWPYLAYVTFYIDNKDGTRKPSGWSTRTEDGAEEDDVISIVPGQGLVPGWTEGLLQMKEGERAELYIPAEKGYGHKTLGTPGSDIYIPPNSPLIIDVEVIAKDSDFGVFEDNDGSGEDDEIDEDINSYGFPGDL